MTADVESKIREKVEAYNNPNKRRALSSRYPFLSPYSIGLRRVLRNLQNYLSLGFPLQKGPYMDCVVARHSSPLYRKLGTSDPQLQVNKVKNLSQAIAKLDGLIIMPGKTFSFWHQVGKVSYKKGYVDGLVLSQGNMAQGVGGGLCQLSNFLFWIFLHTDVEIVERYHHSVDVFPDSGRTIPFGAGATVYSNYIDLKVKNVSPYPLQIKIGLTPTQLKGSILSTHTNHKKFHLYEVNHHFVKGAGKYFRYNEIWRDTFVMGIKTKEEKVIENFAPVMYSLDDAAVSFHVNKN